MVNTKTLFDMEYKYRNDSIRTPRNYYNTYDNLNVKDGYNLLTTFHYAFTTVYKRNAIFSNDSSDHAIHFYDRFLNLFFDYNFRKKLHPELFKKTYSATVPTILSEFTNDQEYFRIRKDNASYIKYYIESNPGFSSDEFVDEKYDIVYIKSNIAVIYFNTDDVIIAEKYLHVYFSYYNDLIISNNDIKPIMFYNVHNIKEIQGFDDYIATLSEKDENVINSLKREYREIVVDSLESNI